MTLLGESFQWKKKIVIIPGIIMILCILTMCIYNIYIYEDRIKFNDLWSYIMLCGAIISGIMAAIAFCIGKKDIVYSIIGANRIEFVT